MSAGNHGETKKIILYIELKQVSPLITRFHFSLHLHISFLSSPSSFLSLSHFLPWCLIYGKRSSGVPAVISHGETVTNTVILGNWGTKLSITPRVHQDIQHNLFFFLSPIVTFTI